MDEAAQVTPYWVEIAVAVGAGLGIAIASPDLVAWIHGAPPVQTSAPDCRPIEKVATHYAGLVAASLNGARLVEIPVANWEGPR